MRFVEDLELPDLGIGAGMIVWGFRASAAGRARCCVLTQGFDKALGEAGPMGLGGLAALAREIGFRGRRKVSLSAPGCIRVTADELSLIACVSTAQSGQFHEMTAHLSWLLAQSQTGEAGRLVQLVSRAFSHAGLEVKKPEMEITPAPDHALSRSPQPVAAVLH